MSMKGKRYEFKVEYDSYGHHKNYSKFFLRKEEIKRFSSELLVKYARRLLHLRAVKSAQSQRDFTRRLLIVSKTLHKNDLEVNVI
jgi:plasmid maintenance system killer protein